MIGTTISHYKVLEKLGGGGMGVVYRAEDLKLGRQVALKFLPEAVADDPGALARFQREARAASALNHPNICVIHELGEEEDRSFIVMELMEGQTLKYVVRRGPMPVDEIVRIGIQVADALEAAHGAKIVHRDIKPANLFVTRRGDVKMLDFGLAKIAEERARRESSKAVTEAETELAPDHLTAPGTALGTITYMSPEQVRGQELDERTDLFSLGVVLYEMATGKQPFGADTAGVIFNKILTATPTAPVRVNPELPDDLERVITKALEKDRALRYQSAAELKADLLRLERDQTAAPVPAQAKVSPRALRWPYLVLGAAVLLLLLGLGWALWPGRGMEESSRVEVPESPAAEAVPTSILGPVSPRSIAVLPFDNLSPDPENAYFADGMTEEIISRLSQLGELTVISRTSVMRYKDSDKPLREIAQELHVANILEGSVRRAGDEVRITGQLIEAASDSHLWSDIYQRRLEDVFAVQADVAEQIASALELELSPAERERLSRQSTASVSAYDYYVKGWQYYLRYRKEDNERAIELYEKALAEDPGFALAHAGLAYAYDKRATRYGFPRDEWLDAALQQANKARELDPTLAKVHVALAVSYGSRGDYEKALQAALRAHALNPSSSDSLINLGANYAQRGQLDEALPWYKKAVVRDPARSFTYGNMGAAYGFLDMHTAAARWLERGMELEPDSVHLLSQTAYVQLTQENYAGVLEMATRVLAASPKEPMGLAMAGMAHWFAGNTGDAESFFRRDIEAYWWTSARVALAQIAWQAGREDEAREILAPRLRSLQRNLEAHTVWPGDYGELAEIYAVLGDRRRAYSMLEKRIEAGAVFYRIYRREPCFAWMRDEQRFRDLMAQIETRVLEMRRRVEARESS